MKHTIAICLAMLLLLAGCGGEPQEAAAEPAGSAASAWTGEGRCYVPDMPPEAPELGIEGCICRAGEDVYSVSYIEAGGDSVRLVKNGETLFALDFSNAFALQKAGDGFWIVAEADGRPEARLYSDMGELKANVPLESPPADALTDGEGLWLDYGNEVEHILPDGSTESVRPTQDYDHIVLSSEGEPFICTQSSGGRVLPLAGGGGFEANGIIASGDGEAFLYEARSDGIYALERNGNASLLISYEECMIEMGKLFAFEPIGDGRFLMERPLGDMLLRPADPSEIGVKERLTIAVFDDYQELNEFIVRFNASNSDYEVVPVNYCEDGQSVEQGQMRLNTELAAGKGPDMIAFTASWKNANNQKSITAPAYIARGWLEDMTHYIESDPVLNAENVAVYKALGSAGGVYLFGNTFTINGLSGTEEQFGDISGWTIDDYLKMEASLDERQSMAYAMDEHVFIEHVGGQYVRDAIAWRSGTVDFDTAEFAAILKAAARVEEDNTKEFETLESFTTAWQRIGSGQMMVDMCFICSPDYCSFDEKFTGKKCSYFGWPSVDGQAGLTVALDNPVGIVSAGEQKEACWEFIRYAAINTPVGLSERALPVYMPLIDRWSEMLLDNELTDTVETKADLEQFYEILERPESVEIYDGTVIDIVFEEAEEYFAGNRTAEEAAARVQERVSLYVAEQS